MRKAGDGAQRHPPDRIDENAGQQRDDGDQRGEAGEGAHMADALDDLGRQQAAEHEAGRPGRAEQAEDGGRIALMRAAHRQQQAVQAVAEEEEQGAEQEREDGEKVFSHRVSLWTQPE